MKNILICVCIIIGTIIGAGFASGQEIVSFFNRFGINGLFGIMLACLLFGIISIVMLILSNKNDIDSYKKLVGENKYFYIIMEIFSLFCFCIMLSGIVAFFEEMYGISYWYGAIISGVICVIMLLFRFKGMEKINMVLVPLIILGIAILGFQKYDLGAYPQMTEVKVTQLFTNSWVISAMLYASYNSIILIPILTNFRRYKLKKIQIVLIGILVTIFLFIMAFTIYNICEIYYPQIAQTQLPTLKLATMCGKYVKHFYGIVIISAILTTAFSTGYNFLVMQKEENYNRNTVIICMIAVLVSRLGFSNLINILFPLFGYLGVLQILLIIFLQKTVTKKGKD